MFDKAIYNVQGAVPFNPNIFPILIGLNAPDFSESGLCKTPDDVPLGEDFVVLKLHYTKDQL